MKKCLKYILLLFVLISLTGCGNNKYSLIEVSSPQVIDAIKDKKSFILASINMTDVNRDKYKDDLIELAKRKQENIYYISSEHTVFADEMNLYEYMGIDMLNLSFTTFQNGELKETILYSNYDTLYQTLSGFRYKGEIEKLDEEYVSKVVSEAHSYYEEGLMSTAYNLLSSVWSSEEAKKEYEDNPYYKIVKEWENYEMLDDGKARCNRLSIYSFEDKMYEASKVDDFESFTLPALSEYEGVDFKVMDDAIYVKNQKGDYSKKYDIKFINETKLVLLKGKKEYSYLIAG